MSPVLEVSSSWWVKKAQKQRNAFPPLQLKKSWRLGLMKVEILRWVVTPLHHVPSRSLEHNSLLSRLSCFQFPSVWKRKRKSRFGLNSL